jgi:hypothetical protein
MNADQLFAELRRRGVELVARSGRLRWRPRDALGPEIVSLLAQHKNELLAALLAGSSPAACDRSQPEVEIRQANLSWDRAQANAIVKRAISHLEVVGYSLDPKLRQQQFEAAGIIDECWLARDMQNLSQAVEQFLELFEPRRDSNSGFPDGFLIPPPACPGCELCRSTGKEPPPRPGEHLSEVLQRIRRASHNAG